MCVCVWVALGGRGGEMKEELVGREMGERERLCLCVLCEPLCRCLLPLQEVLLKALGTVCVSCKSALLNPQDPNQPTADKVRVSFSYMQSGNETGHSCLEGPGNEAINSV